MSISAFNFQTVFSVTFPYNSHPLVGMKTVLQREVSLGQITDIGATQMYSWLSNTYLTNLQKLGLASSKNTYYTIDYEKIRQISLQFAPEFIFDSRAEDKPYNLNYYLFWLFSEQYRIVQNQEGSDEYQLFQTIWRKYFLNSTYNEEAFVSFLKELTNNGQGFLRQDFFSPEINHQKPPKLPENIQPNVFVNLMLGSQGLITQYWVFYAVKQYPVVASISKGAMKIQRCFAQCQLLDRLLGRIATFGHRLADWEWFGVYLVPNKNLTFRQIASIYPNQEGSHIFRLGDNSTVYVGQKEHGSYLTKKRVGRFLDRHDGKGDHWNLKVADVQWIQASFHNVLLDVKPPFYSLLNIVRQGPLRASTSFLHQRSYVISTDYFEYLRKHEFVSEGKIRRAIWNILYPVRHHPAFPPFGAQKKKKRF